MKIIGLNPKPIILTPAETAVPAVKRTAGPKPKLIPKAIKVIPEIKRLVHEAGFPGVPPITSLTFSLIFINLPNAPFLGWAGKVVPDSFLKKENKIVSGVKTKAKIGNIPKDKPLKRIKRNPANTTPKESPKTGLPNLLEARF